MPQQAQSMKLAILNGNPNNLTKKTIKKRLKTEKNFEKIGDKHIVAPSWLSDESRRTFNEIRRNLKPLGILNDLDNALLARFAATYDKYIRINKLIDESDLNPEGNPLLKEFASLDRQLAGLSKELGLLPSARASLALALKDEPDKGENEEF